MNYRHLTEKEQVAVLEGRIYEWEQMHWRLQLVLEESAPDKDVTNVVAEQALIESKIEKLKELLGETAE